MPTLQIPKRENPAPRGSTAPGSRTGEIEDLQPPRPPLKWAGGKRWQVPHLRPLWAAHAQRRLVEPFCGGLAVSLGLAPGRALLNDINPHVIAFYRRLKQGLVITQPMKNDETMFYARRARFNALLARGREEGREAAGLFYYLNRTGYNGLCRFNRRGSFNVPFGRYARITYTRDFTRYRRAFARWDFISVDFEKVPLEKGDFVYADPPYDVEFTIERVIPSKRLRQTRQGQARPALALDQQRHRPVTLVEPIELEPRVREPFRPPRATPCSRFSITPQDDNPNEVKL